MTSSTTKDFDPIRADYAFFEDHSSEAVEDIRAYLPHVESLATGGGPIRMLDFGCGPGRFTEQFLASAAWPVERLQLWLVEPVAAYRQQAVERLQPFSNQHVNAVSELPEGMTDCFDLILSNHVFYYVSKLDAALSSIHRALAAEGLFLAAMAGQENRLIQFWYHCYALIGKPVPHHTAEDFEAALARRQIPFAKENVEYKLAFPDLEEHRLSILRFLMGEDFAAVPRQAMLDLFDPFADGGKIAMSITHDHFVLRRRA